MKEIKIARDIRWAVRWRQIFL